MEQQFICDKCGSFDWFVHFKVDDIDESHIYISCSCGNINIFRLNYIPFFLFERKKKK